MHAMAGRDMCAKLNMIGRAADTMTGWSLDSNPAGHGMNQKTTKIDGTKGSEVSPTADPCRSQDRGFSDFSEY